MSMISEIFSVSKKQYVVVIQPFFSSILLKNNAKAVMVSTLQLHKIQMWITRGRVLNEELYAQRFHRLIHLHLFTEYFMKIYPQALERFWPLKRNVQEFETVCKQMQLNQILKSLYTPITAVIDIHAPQEKLFSSRAYDWWDIAWYLFHHCTGMWIKHCIILQYQMLFDGCSAV